MGRESNSDKAERLLLERLTKAMYNVTRTTEKWNGSMIDGLSKMTKYITSLKETTVEEKEKTKRTKEQTKVEIDYNKTRLMSKKMEEGLIKLRHTLKVELEKEHGDQVRRNIKLRGSMDTFHNTLNFITKSLTKGVGIGTVFQKLAVNAADVTKAFQDIKAAREGLANDRKGLAGLKASRDSSTGDMEKYFNELIFYQEKTVIKGQKTLMIAETSKGAQMLQSRGIQTMAKKLSSAGDFFNKHKTGILLGVGGAGILIGIIKKALDVSPMFQAMMKLLQTTVTFILRPIGDFFGFLLKPILLIILRNFVLPWFRVVFPVLRNLGTDGGNMIAGTIDRLSKGDIIGALFGDNALFTHTIIQDAIFGKDFKLFGDGENGIITNIAAMGVSIASALAAFKLAETAMTSINTKLTTLLQNILGTAPTPTPTIDPIPNVDPIPDGKPTIDPEVNKSPIGNNDGIQKPTSKPPITYRTANEGVTGTTTGGGEVGGRNTENKFNNGRTQGTNQTKIQKQVSRLAELFKRSPEKAITQLKNLGRGVVSSAMNSGKGIPKGGMGVAGMMWADMLLQNGLMIADDIQQLWGGESWFPESQAAKVRANSNYGIDPNEGYTLGGGGTIANAEGGMINEPVVGQGLNSGRKYTFGERGSEMVTPMSGKGSGGMGGGVVVNINISNMSGDRNDVDKLRKTILDVMHESNTYRGRV